MVTLFCWRFSSRDLRIYETISDELLLVDSFFVQRPNVLIAIVLPFITN